MITNNNIKIEKYAGKYLSKGLITTMLVFVILAVLLAVGSTYAAPQKLFDDIDPPEDTLGSISICKIIINGSGNIVDGSEFPGYDFSIEITNPDGGKESTGFSTPLVLNADIIGDDDVNDAMCVTKTGLGLGTYNYSEESRPLFWVLPKYNDQDTVTVSTLNDFFAYGSTINSDGAIELTSERTDREIVILNKYHASVLNRKRTVCEININRNADEIESLHIETTNTDPNLNNLWTSLWGVLPGIDSDLVMQKDKVLVWHDGIILLNGSMNASLTQTGELKTLKLKNDGEASFFIGTGGLNPQVDQGGWHSVEIREINNAFVGFDRGGIAGTGIIGTLKNLKLKLKNDSKTIDDFELEIVGTSGELSEDEFKITLLYVNVPETRITALEGREYEEFIKDDPPETSGHTEAESRSSSPELADINGLNDGSNNDLIQRVGPCAVEEVPVCGNSIREHGEECDDGNNENSDGCSSQCLFENPQLTVIKLVFNNNGGNKTIADFPLFVNGTAVTSGVANNLSAGSYVVSETNQPGYAARFGGHCSPDGFVTLSGTERKICFITNNDIPARLTVIKHVINDNGGTAGASDFEITVNGSGVFNFTGSETGTDVDLNAGNYVVVENGPDGYDASFSADCTGTISIGENKTCTITNDDGPFCAETAKTYGLPFFSNGTSDWISSSTLISLSLENNECTSNTTTFYRITPVDDGNCLDDNACQLLEGQVDWNIYSDTFSIPEQSCHLVEFFTNDTAGITETVKKQCVFVDNTPPLAEKNIGNPKAVWDGIDAVFYNISERCWNNQADNLDCWKVTLDTPITLGCNDAEPHPVGNNKIWFNVEFDRQDATDEYCSQTGIRGHMDNETGFCMVDKNSIRLFFTKESEHNLKFFCEDALGNKGPVDEEKFKVTGTAFDIVINKKWNLISVPFVLLDSKADVVFDTVKEDIITVWGYDNGTWFVWTPGEGPDSLENINTGWGYWVLANNDSRLRVGGRLFDTPPATLPTPTKIISPGWNLIGYYGNQDERNNTVSVYDGPDRSGKTSLCALATLTDTVSWLPKWRSLVTYWEPFNPNQFIGLNVDDRMDPGAGYWLELDGSESYTPSTVCLSNNDG